jgi:hypothetical protein
LKDFALGAFEICGSVTVVKEATGAVSTPVFNYATNLGPAFSLSPNITVAGTPATDSTVFDNIMPGNYSITETDDADFGSTTTAECVYAGGAPVTGGTYDLNSANFDVQIGEAITCTFRNAQPQLQVNKLVKACPAPAEDTGSFQLTIDTNNVGDPVKHNQNSGPHWVNMGGHTVGETGAGGTDLADYTSSISGMSNDCDDGNITIDSLGVHTCTITNSRKPKVTVNKTTVGGPAPGSLQLCIGGSCVSATTHEVLLDTETSPGSGVFVGPVVKEIASSLTAYNTAISCNNGQRTWRLSGNADTEREVDLNDTLEAGDHVTCEIVNIYQGTKGCLNPTP